MSTKAAALIALAILTHAAVSWHSSHLRHEEAADRLMAQRFSGIHR